MFDEIIRKNEDKKLQFIKDRLASYYKTLSAYSIAAPPQEATAKPTAQVSPPTPPQASAPVSHPPSAPHDGPRKEANHQTEIKALAHTVHGSKSVTYCFKTRKRM